MTEREAEIASTMPADLDALPVARAMAAIKAKPPELHDMSAPRFYRDTIRTVPAAERRLLLRQLLLDFPVHD
jgi:hypothetical protein